ncbi:MAG: hypothetical protein ABEJ94_00335 [Halorientalis sp.]
MSEDEERWPDEPDDPGSPESVEPDPESDLTPSPPEVDVPEPPDPSENDAPKGLLRSFWKLVAVFNVALFALALGPMLVVFRGQWVDGGIVFVVGVGFFVYGYVRYQHARDRFGED